MPPHRVCLGVMQPVFAQSMGHGALWGHTEKSRDLESLCLVPPATTILPRLQSPVSSRPSGWRPFLPPLEAGGPALAALAAPG